MTRRTNYRGFVCENTNQEVRIVSSYLTRLKKYAKAGKYGKDLFCPYCNHQHRVYHFSWTSLTCHPVATAYEFQGYGQDKKAKPPFRRVLQPVRG